MKFFKQNWLVVVCFLLIIVTLPVGWVFSSSWNKSIKTSQEDAAKKDLGIIERAAVEYKLPAPIPGEPGLSITAAPNQRLTEFFAKERERINAQLQEAKTQASIFNRREHKELVDGLFPKAKSRRDAQLLAVEMVKLLVGDDGGPSEYERLLGSVGAGRPLAAPMLAQTLEDLNQREEQRIQAETGAQTLSEKERQQITHTLIVHRLREYRRRARELSFYADVSIFFQGAAAATPPIAVPPQPPEIDECFLWQFDYWVYKDILDAIRLANTSQEGNPLGIELAPVKRVNKITVDPLIQNSGLGGPRNPPPPSGRPGSRGAPPDPGYGDPEPDLGGAPSGGEIPRDYSISVTGRMSGPANQTYDVRSVELDVIIASKKIPALIDALAQTNFMTVTGLAIEQVDSWEHLQQGFYYGPDNVVRLTLQIETIWLRDWTVPLMPDPIVSALGVIKQEPQSPEDDG